MSKKRQPPTFPEGPCREPYCQCSGGRHVCCGVARERDQNAREALMSLGAALRKPPLDD